MIAKCGAIECDNCKHCELSDDDFDAMVADTKRIKEICEQGHQYHCACRQVWGDGECECNGDRAANGPYMVILDESD